MADARYWLLFLLVQLHEGAGSLSGKLRSEMKYFPCQQQQCCAA
jgi:hypothetical protein